VKLASRVVAITGGSFSQEDNMGYWYLTIAIVAEVLATSALKESQGFSRLVPSLLVVAGYGASFYFLSLVLQTIPIGVAYALWAGLGIVLITIVGVVMFGQKMDLPAILGIALIICGVVVLRAFSSIEA
jgi:small multidrug resistance pump